MGIFRSLFGAGRESAVPGVNAPELKQLLDTQEDILLVDVRSPFEYEHDGHIEGARLLPLQNLMQHVDELPQDKDIVVVCRSGNRSMVAGEQLMRLGYTRVKNFNGGMIAWQKAGFPTS